MYLIVCESAERVASYLASFDAEHRAACEARRRTLESEVAGTADQSTMEFRSTMKAFLYSCLVAAVGAVDEHAQATLAGIAKSPSSSAITLDAAAVSSRKNEETASAMDASAISSELRGQ